MQRIQKLQRKLSEKKCQAFWITNPYNVRYLSGYVGTNGRLLVTPKKAILITDFRYLRSAKKQIPKGVEIYDQKEGIKKLLTPFKTIGYEQEHLTVSDFGRMKKVLPKMKWVPVSGAAEELRLIKDENEMVILRKACRMADEALRRLKKHIKVGVSEDELDFRLYAIMRELGADGFSFPPIICFGKNTADVHHIKEPNRLKKGEPVLIDYGLIYKGYCTDTTRMVYLNKPKVIEQKIYTIVKKAQEAAIKAIKVGKTCGQIDKVARTIIEEAGYGERFGHSTGHGVGLEVHEAPTVSAKSETKIKPGMVFTVEPGIYLDDLGGVRIEDMVYITPKGKVEVLTQLPK
jgi:Xaa-Pro aminopeptidase